MIADDTPEKLKADLAGDTLRLVLAGEAEACAAETAAATLPDAREIARDGNTVRVTLSRGEAMLPRFITLLKDSGIEVAGANVTRPTLDDVFLGLTGRSLRETALAA